MASEGKRRSCGCLLVIAAGTGLLAALAGANIAGLRTQQAPDGRRIVRVGSGRIRAVRVARGAVLAELALVDVLLRMAADAGGGGGPVLLARDVARGAVGRRMPAIERIAAARVVEGVAVHDGLGFDLVGVAEAGPSQSHALSPEAGAPSGE